MTRHAEHPDSISYSPPVAIPGIQRHIFRELAHDAAEDTADFSDGGPLIDCCRCPKRYETDAVLERPPSLRRKLVDPKQAGNAAVTFGVNMSAF